MNNRQCYTQCALGLEEAQGLWEIEWASRSVWKVFSKKVLSGCIVKLDREGENDILGRGNNIHQGTEARKKFVMFERPR